MWARVAPARSRFVAIVCRAWCATADPRSRLSAQSLNASRKLPYEMERSYRGFRTLVGNRAIAALSAAAGCRPWRFSKRARVLARRASSWR